LPEGNVKKCLIGQKNGGFTMRKLGAILKYACFGVAFYTLLSMGAQSGLYALCYNYAPKTEGVIREVLNWFMSVDATTCRIMMTVIFLSIIESRSRFLHLILGIGLGWAAMTLWRLLFSIELPIAWHQIASDWFVAVLVTAIAAMPWHPRTKRVRQTKGKHAHKGRKTEERNQPRQPREDREQIQSGLNNQETQRVVRISDVQRRNRNRSGGQKTKRELSWEAAAEEEGLWIENPTRFYANGSVR